jgi:hypothetical protein
VKQVPLESHKLVIVVVYCCHILDLFLRTTNCRCLLLPHSGPLLTYYQLSLFIAATFWTSSYVLPIAVVYCCHILDLLLRTTNCRCLLLPHSGPLFTYYQLSLFIAATFWTSSYVLPIVVVYCCHILDLFLRTTNCPCYCKTPTHVAKHEPCECI